MMYIENNSKRKVLEAKHDGKVIPEILIDGKADQLWTKGVPDAEGYFTLQKSGEPEFLTAISINSLRSKDRAAKPIQWRMAPTPQERHDLYRDLWIRQNTTQRADIRKMKESILYKQYRNLNQVQQIKTPTKHCLTVQHWQLKMERWKCELQMAVEENTNRKEIVIKVADHSGADKDYRQPSKYLQKEALGKKPK